MEQGVTACEGHLAHGGAELRGLLVIERREERGAPQNVVHESLSYVDRLRGTDAPYFAGRLYQCDQSQGCRTYGRAVRREANRSGVT
ncbi:hypothetical protein GCM10010425_40560 [Streptomyces spororaveus]|uniref:Uncharacterized protein n=1 Tax=Streptomyces spororaveus TaxID=284039 RepID=A0ABQ3TE90_9ACTN|nr:hypothetical protein Sspor_42910 [Streptomyces spororaveus]